MSLEKSTIQGMRAAPLLFIKLPLIDDKGYLSRLTKNRPPFLPRVGESLYLLPNLSSKVVSVNYSGWHYQVITLTLEPISSSHIKELTERKKNKWTYDRSRPIS